MIDGYGASEQMLAGRIYTIAGNPTWDGNPAGGGSHTKTIDQGGHWFGEFANSDAMTTGAAQADYFIAHGGGWSKDGMTFPGMLDMEWNPHSPTCKLRPPRETVRAEMSVFLQAVERHYGKKPIIYTSVDFFDDNDLSTFRGYPCWLRSVAGHPREKYGSHPCTFWQYTGTGIVPGMPGKSDINVFNGTEAAWSKWLRQNTR